MWNIKSKHSLQIYMLNLNVKSEYQIYMLDLNFESDYLEKMQVTLHHAPWCSLRSRTAPPNCFSALVNLLFVGFLVNNSQWSLILISIC